MLIGLAAKNAILIVEFAKQLRGPGQAAFEATVEACRLRLRPILMTSFAFILGVVPLVLAKGAGAEMRDALGIAVFSGMLGVTLFGIFFTPVFYFVIRWLTARKKKSPAAGTGPQRRTAPRPAPRRPPRRGTGARRACRAGRALNRPARRGPRRCRWRRRGPAGAATCGDLSRRTASVRANSRRRRMNSWIGGWSRRGTHPVEIRPRQPAGFPQPGRRGA